MDANGLQMTHKRLNQRKEYELSDSKLIESNYHPVTSAIAIKDFNKTAKAQTQVLVMMEQSHGASAGIRDKANIEIMHQRRRSPKLAL